MIVEGKTICRICGRLWEEDGAREVGTERWAFGRRAE